MGSLASDTPPVRELNTHWHGLLADFFDADALAKTALKVLRAPGDYRELGANAARRVHEHYSAETALPKLLDFFERNANGASADRRGQ